MDLPIRILAQAPTYPAVVVDGSFAGAPPPTLHLSHWPGNLTPKALKHELSSGIALAFLELPPAEQRALVGDAQALVNSHYDTDGSLALFALRHPEQARPRRELILQASAAGDFFRWPSDLALCIDAIVTGLSQPEHSPLAKDLEHLDSIGRWQACSEHLMQKLPQLLDGEIGAYKELWQPVLAQAKLDAAALSRAPTSQFPELGLQLWSPSSGALAPGRHALFKATARERVIVLSELPGGTSARLIESTLTWFDIPSRSAAWRPDFEPLAAELNSLEGSSPEAQAAWQAQPKENASPELWFGRRKLSAFAEHNRAQELSCLAAESIMEVVRRHLVNPGS